MYLGLFIFFAVNYDRKSINPSNKDWGKGQVQSIIKSKVTINFENTGKKVINAEIINLEKIKK